MGAFDTNYKKLGFIVDTLWWARLGIGFLLLYPAPVQIIALVAGCQILGFQA